MRTRIARFCCIFAFAALLLPNAAFSWGWAAHAFVDEQFSTKWALRNGNHLYGGFSPDMFLYRFDAPAYRAYLFEQTHHNYMEIWNTAESVPAKAAAFGFVSHNEEWGIDSTAHRSGITFGAGQGYVIAKARILKTILDQAPEFVALQLPEPIALEVAHEMVEYGVDVLVKNLDSTIGAKITAAARQPNPNIPLVVEQAYADGLAAQFNVSRVDANRFIASSEGRFRELMLMYGQVLMQDNDTAVLLLARRLNDIAVTFLAAYGLSLPPGADVTPLAQFGIYQAMSICAADFAPELTATADFVAGQLAARGITY